MKHIIKQAKVLTKKGLRHLDLELTRYGKSKEKSFDSAAAKDLKRLMEFPGKNAALNLQCLKLSMSQLRQDLFVLNQLDFKINGFFVEFGATNGVDLSNTHLLEKHFGWTGILAEPARCWHGELEKNRRSIIEKKCVWKASGQTLLFNQADIGELSTIERFIECDNHAPARQSGTRYAVQTMSLNDLLFHHDAPLEIDYLSIDTEGSELEILNSFDFSRHSFRVITVEHNFTSARDDLFRLLTSNGYTRVYENISEWDDWYVRVDV